MSWKTRGGLKKKERPLYDQDGVVWGNEWHGAGSPALFYGQKFSLENIPI